MCFGSPSVPSAPPPTPAAVATPTATAQDPSVLSRQDADRRRRLAAMGQSSTMLTSGAGIPNVFAQGKTLLGS